MNKARYNALQIKRAAGTLTQDDKAELHEICKAYLFAELTANIDVFKRLAVR